MNNSIKKAIPIWLFLLILALIIILPIIIAALMDWNVFSEAPGNTDAWISFWGSFLGGIFGMIGVIVTTFFIIQNQANLSKAERKEDFEQKNLELILEWLFEIKYLIGTSDLKRLNTENDIIWKGGENHNSLSGQILTDHQKNLISVEEDVKRMKYLCNSLKLKFLLINEESMLDEYTNNIFNYCRRATEFNYFFLNKSVINPKELLDTIYIVGDNASEVYKSASIDLDYLIDKISMKVKKLHNNSV